MICRLALHLCCLLLAACIGTGRIGAASAEVAPLWNEVDRWEVRVDRRAGTGCFITTAYAGGSQLRIGFMPEAKAAYMLLANDAWRSLEIGKFYDIQVQFTGEAPWAATAEAIAVGEGKALEIIVSDVQFLVEAMRRTAVAFHYRGELLDHLSLRGSFRAMSEMMRCQEAIDEKTRENNRQRQKPGSRNSDPFA